MGLVPVGDDALVATIAMTERLEGRRKRGHSARRDKSAWSWEEKSPQRKIDQRAGISQ